MKKELGTFVVHIENIENGVPKGWFMNPYMKEQVTFHDYGDMELKIDDTLLKLQQEEEQVGISSMNYFQSFRDISYRTKPLFFYLIQILYTCNSSWQGLIAGTDRPKVTFKSALDCIRKMNDAMQEHQAYERQSKG